MLISESTYLAETNTYIPLQENSKYVTQEYLAKQIAPCLKCDVIITLFIKKAGFDVPFNPFCILTKKESCFRLPLALNKTFSLHTMDSVPCGLSTS